MVASIATRAVHSITAMSTGPRSLRSPTSVRVVSAATSCDNPARPQRIPPRLPSGRPPQQTLPFAAVLTHPGAQPPPRGRCPQGHSSRAWSSRCGGTGRGAGASGRTAVGWQHMRLMDRLYDNDWYVASARPEVQADVAADLLRAAQAHDVAMAEVERARAVSPAAVVLALSSTNATQAALGRAQARAKAASQCNHVVDGHAFAVREVTGVTGDRDFVIASCTLERTVTMRPPTGVGRWTAVLIDPGSRHRPDAVVSLRPTWTTPSRRPVAGSCGASSRRLHRAGHQPPRPREAPQHEVRRARQPVPVVDAHPQPCCTCCHVFDHRCEAPAHDAHVPVRHAVLLLRLSPRPHQPRRHRERRRPLPETFHETQPHGIPPDPHRPAPD